MHIKYKNGPVQLWDDFLQEELKDLDINTKQRMEQELRQFDETKWEDGVLRVVPSPTTTEADFSAIPHGGVETQEVDKTAIEKRVAKLAADMTEHFDEVAFKVLVDTPDEYEAYKRKLRSRAKIARHAFNYGIGIKRFSVLSNKMDETDISVTSEAVADHKDNAAFYMEWIETAMADAHRIPSAFDAYRYLMDSFKRLRKQIKEDHNL